MHVSRRSALTVLVGWALLGLPRADAGFVGYNEDAKWNGPGFANDFEIVIPGNRFFNNFRFGFPGGVVNTNFNSVTNQTTLTFSGGNVAAGTVVHFGYTLLDGFPNSHG